MRFICAILILNEQSVSKRKADMVRESDRNDQREVQKQEKVLLADKQITEISEWREWNMKKRVWGILALALWMVFCLVPVTVRAEGESPIELTQANYKSCLETWSYGQYLKSGNYILKEDIILDATLLIGYQDQAAACYVTLDLNGYVLKQGNTGLFPVIQVCQDSTLILQDSRPDVIHRFSADSTGLWHLDEENGDRIVTGGIITGSVKTGLKLQAVNEEGSIAQCTMNGGNIVGCTYNSYGGGVCVGDGAVFTMNGGSIRGCTVTDQDYGRGGGVYLVGSTFIMNGGVISDCVAPGDGGDALYLTDNRGIPSSFSMSADAIINGTLKDDNAGGSLGVYTITFDPDGGTAVSPQVRPAGALAVRPEDPIKADWVFDGWYNGGTAYDFTQPVTADLTLQAKWIQHIHCVCGGNIAVGDHTVHTDELWVPWTAEDALPGNAGNYYLVKDVTLPSGQIALPEGVNLCLNGKALKGAGSDTRLSIDGKMTVTDCSRTGSLGDFDVEEGAFTIMGNLGNMGELRIEDKATLTVNGDISSGIFHGTVICNGEILDGAFYDKVENNGKITGGIFYGEVSGAGTIEDSAMVAVSFESDGGSSVDGQKLLRGRKAAAPTEPKRVGYLLECWTQNGTAFDFETPIIKDTVLTAKWKLCDHSASTVHPTCTEAVTCTVCKGKYESLGHSYGETAYTWKGIQCMAERVCTRDVSHKETESVLATAAVTRNRTCTLDELSVYTAVFTNPVFDEQKKEDVKTADKLGHSFTVQQHDETKHWNKCSRCDEINGKENHVGGTADCREQAECMVCHIKYGAVDPDHHSSLKKVDGVSATAADTGTREHWRCEACGKLFSDATGSNEITAFDTILWKTAPSIIEGMNGRWNKGREDGLSFKSDGAYADFIEVLVDGGVISADNYTVREGSILVELKAGYLATLTEGEHTITIRSESGGAATQFSVSAKRFSPKTGYEWAWNIAAAAAIGGVGVMAAVVINRKRKAA